MHSSFKCICSHPWNNYFWIWRFWRSKMILTCIQGVLLLAVIINICINRPRNAASSRLMTPRLIQLIIQDHLFSRERSLFWAEANNWTWARIRKSPSCKPMSTHLCQVHIIILFIQIHTSSKRLENERVWLKIQNYEARNKYASGMVVLDGPC